MKKNRFILDKLFIKLIYKNRAIQLNLIEPICLEQFSSLSYYLHFISTQIFIYCENCHFPNEGWISLDKELENYALEDVFLINFSNILSIFKKIKKEVSFDLRCLKKFQKEILSCTSIVSFIEEVALSNEDLFKRVCLRQLKRIYNQKKFIVEGKLRHQPSKINNLLDVWNLINFTFNEWSGGHTQKKLYINQPTLEELGLNEINEPIKSSSNFLETQIDSIIIPDLTEELI